MATEKKLKEFRVLEYNFNTRQKSTYDVLPYFRRMWYEAEWDCFEKSKVKTKLCLFWQSFLLEKTVKLTKNVILKQ